MSKAPAGPRHWYVTLQILDQQVWLDNNQKPRAEIGQDLDHPGLCTVFHTISTQAQSYKFRSLSRCWRTRTFIAFTLRNLLMKLQAPLWSLLAIQGHRRPPIAAHAPEQSLGQHAGQPGAAWAAEPALQSIEFTASQLVMH